MYYLKSRYYNPRWGRFLNADVYCTTGMSVISTNMFAYCYNNPTMRIDADGYASVTINCYKNGFGHADMTIDRTTYSYGCYGSGGFVYKDALFGRAQGYIIKADETSWRKYEQLERKITSFTITVSENEKETILNFYKDILGVSKFEREPDENLYYKGKVYKVSNGNYMKYSFLLNNCVTAVTRALYTAIPEELWYVGDESYGDGSYFIGIFIPAVLAFFMNEYDKYYDCTIRFYNKKLAK